MSPESEIAKSGEQFVLAAGPSRACVAQVGATLRELSFGERPVLDGFDADVVCPGGAGQVLAPWPNRLEDGSYVFAGTKATAPLDEPSRNNAIHGLVRWLAWRPIHLESSAVTLACPLAPQPGYPWQLEVELDYRLSPGSLTVTVSARNASSAPAPFGIGFHPYLLAGARGVDAARLELEASSRLVFDARGLPIDVEELDDPRQPGDLRGTVLDACYTGLRRDSDGYWRVRFRADEEADEVVVFADQHFGYVMCFTGDTLEPPRRRRAIAVEPMTCPPNALRSSTDLVVLAPKETFSAVWGIALG